MKESKEFKRMQEIAWQLPYKQESVTEFIQLYAAILAAYEFSNMEHLNGEVRTDIAHLEGMNEGVQLDQNFRDRASTAIRLVQEYAVTDN